MKKYLRTLAVVAAVVGLGVSACGSPPPANNGKSDGGSKTSSGKGGSTPAQKKNFKACMVSDAGGFDDKSFNQTSYKGFVEAIDQLGLQKAQLESQSDNDYQKNVNTLVSQKCNIIVTVGFKLGDVTYAAAKANPNIDFAIVDYGFDPKKQPPLKNLKSLLFNAAQPSFLAGYLAAGMTKSGKVGTFGGVKIPTVTIFMDGFWEGVQYYNKQKHKNVQVLGWSEPKQDGTFTNTFDDKNQGVNKANNLVSQGADILFPVAGPVGEGALQAAKASGGKVNAIWVDTDGCISAANYCPVLLSSATKGMDVAVKEAVENSAKGSWDPSPFVGTLKNDGVSLAPFHDWKSKIPADLQSEIDKLRQGIIDGSVTIASKAQP